jgi:hypothetical protein
LLFKCDSYRYTEAAEKEASDAKKAAKKEKVGAVHVESSCPIA